MWIDLEYVTLSKVSLKERDRYRMITLLCGM